MSSPDGRSFVGPPQVLRLDTNAVRNIRLFRRQWKHYARVTGIDELGEQVKMSVLFSLIDETARSLVDSLLIRRVITETRNVDSILSALENHFLPRDNVIYERYMFNRIAQNVDEKVESFANRVRYQAARCDFRDQLYDFVRDRFVVGLADENLKNFLLTKNTLTFEDAYNLSREVERTAGYRRSIRSPIAPRIMGSKRPVFESFTSTQPSCPTEDLVWSPHSRTRAKGNDGVSRAVRLSPFSDQLFPSQNCQMYRSAADSLVRSAKLRTELEIGTYVALRNHFKNLRKNPPIWRVHCAEFLQKFSPSVEGGVTVYKSSAVYFNRSRLTCEKFEKLEIEKETERTDANGKVIRLVRPKARVNFEVGSYIVLSGDLKTKNKPPIWKVCNASVLQKFVPHPEGGFRTYINDNIHVVYTDWTWRLSGEDYHEVAIVNETIKEYIPSYKVITVQLRNNAFEFVRTGENQRPDPSKITGIIINNNLEKNVEKESLVQSGTSSKTKFAVGTYVVRKLDLKNAYQASIWRVCSPSSLQKFTPRVDENGDTEYVNFDTNTTYSDSQWEHYKEVDITKETTKVDFFGRKVMTVRLREDIFKFDNKAHIAEKEEKSSVNASRNVIESVRTKSKLRKTRIGKIKKSRKRKIRHQICLGLVCLMCCCS